MRHQEVLPHPRQRYIGLTSEGEKEDEGDKREGEYVHLCVPLTAGCVQISVNSKYFPAFLNKGESTYYIDYHQLL